MIEKIRPFIKMHGGDVQFRKIDGDAVILDIQGACVGCPLSHLTYDKIIGGIIKQEVPGINKVILKSTQK